MNRRSFLTTMAGAVVAYSVRPTLGGTLGPPAEPRVLNDDTAMLQRRLDTGQPIIGESHQISKTLIIRPGNVIRDCYIKASSSLRGPMIYVPSGTRGAVITRCWFNGGGFRYGR